MTLGVSLTTVTDVTVVGVDGVIDGAVVEDLRAALVSAVSAASGLPIIDLAGVEYIDSAGIGVFIALANAPTPKDAAFVLVCPPGPANRILQLSGLHHVVVVFEDLEAALRFVRKRREPKRPDRRP